MAYINDSVKALRPERNEFDLSHDTKLTCDMGELIPVLAEECIPGDVIRINNQVLVRMQPMFAPIMHRIDVTVHYFFVPYRILMGGKWKLENAELWTTYDNVQNEFEDFITGGEDGTEPGGSDAENALPRDIPDIRSPSIGTVYGPGSLWEHLDFPILADKSNTVLPYIRGTAWSRDNCPLAFPRRAYNLIYWEYYRDQNVEKKNTIPAKIPTGDENIHNWTYWEYCAQNEIIRHRAWQKDYFTSALPTRQRGIAPSIPIIGTGQVIANNMPDQILLVNEDGLPLHTPQVKGTGPAAGPITLSTNGTGVSTTQKIFTSGQALAVGISQNVQVDTSTLTSIDVNDLRLIIQTQKWMERQMRCGSRYAEHLRAHYGADPGDARLQRPEYIGGSKSAITITEVLQTGADQATPAGNVSPQANMAGHGITADETSIETLRVPEWGIVMGILSIMPKPAYQQGFNRQWMRKTRYDFPTPEFAHIGEQPIEVGEIFATGNDDDRALFAYQGQYNECRQKMNRVHGLFRSASSGSLDYWHLARVFAEAPTFNINFIKCDATTNGLDGDLKRIFAITGQPGFIVDIGHLITAYRPLPLDSEPGFMDHF